MTTALLIRAKHQHRYIRTLLTTQLRHNSTVPTAGVLPNIPVPATYAASGASARSVIVKLLQNIGSKKEVEQYLKYYSSLQTPRFAVIKVGGGVIEDELSVLVESLAFLSDVGLLPVVLHGGGPQLNAELKKHNIVSDYHDGIRVTTPEILSIARKVFLSANNKLVQALEEYGTRARPIVSGVFESDYLDRDKFQMVGNITKVNIEQVVSALELGQLPILTCMGETTTGQYLNVNADVGGQELAKALKPVKVVYLSGKGGLLNESGELIQHIDLELDYQHLMTQPWFKYGDRLKLREIKTLLDALPLSSSVAITSAQNLPKELFTHKGSGTLIKRSEKINIYHQLDSNQVDQKRITKLIEKSFGGKLHDDFLSSITPNIHRVILTDSYAGLALVTLDQSINIPYLDKFAVTKLSQGEGTGQLLWNVLKRECKSLYWRSRANNIVNSWYFERAQGSYTADGWTVFWYGLQSFDQAQLCINNALSRNSTIDRTVKIQHDDELDTTPILDTLPIKQTWSNRRQYSTSSRSQSSFHNTHTISNKCNRIHTISHRTFTTQHHINASSATRIGLIGARGHTGSELIRLIDSHPNMTLTVASSRQLVGQSIGDVFHESTKSGKFGTVKFENLSPDDITQKSNVDVWILALPNDLAKPYVTALQATSSSCKVVDLSADYRFDSTWQYGLPERHGYREMIKSAQYISNPGCYATGMQCTLLPLHNIISSDDIPTVFGISGYSGAGTNPSRKNDPIALRDNLMPYTLVNHMHEREVSYQLSKQYKHGVRFMPHVAPWFRGISLTVALQLNNTNITTNDILTLYRDYYNNERLIKITESIPEVQAVQNKHHVEIGGVTIHNNRLVVCTTIDNLLKGAATQAIQNINLAQGLHEYLGILH